LGRPVISLFFLANDHCGHDSAKARLFRVRMPDSDDAFFGPTRRKSLAKVYEKKHIFCFISICQAENSPQPRIQQSGTVTETNDVVAIGLGQDFLRTDVSLKTLF
jgi:hypothetical protein